MGGTECRGWFQSLWYGQPEAGGAAARWDGMGMGSPGVGRGELPLTPKLREELAAGIQGKGVGPGHQLGSGRDTGGLF